MASPLLGITPQPAALLDDRTRPDFRDVFGTLASQSSDIVTAVTRVRLSTMNLTESELQRVERFRVLVAEMNAIQLTSDARGLTNDPARAPRLAFLRRMLESGWLEVRAAPLAGWSPDFSVFSNASGPSAVLTGFHWFERPYPHRGPALSSLHFAEAARVAGRRHAELWETAHDIGPAIWSILSKARPRQVFVAAGPG